jgi:O-antigen/teichoic acid export membrane protein
VRRTLRACLSVFRGRSGLATVAQTGATTVAVLAINVVTGILAARFLGAEGRGELSALLLAPQVLSFLFTLGLPAALIVSVKGRTAAEGGLMGAALALSVLMGVVAAGVGFAILPALLGQYDAHVTSVARAFLVCALIGVPATVLAACLQIRDRFAAYNLMRWAQSAAILAGLTVLAVFGIAGAGWWALAYLGAPIPFLLWNGGWAVREFRPTLAQFRTRARELLSYGVRIHAADAVGMLLAQADKLILIAILAPSAFGVYVVVFNLSRLITTFAHSAVLVLLPRTAGKPAAEVLASTSRALSVSMALSFGAVLGFAVLGSLVLRVLYGPDFAGGYWTLLILAAEAALASGAVILQQPYIVMNRAGTVAVFQLASLAVAAASIYVLAHRFGAEGAAAGLLAATLVRFTLTYGAYRRLFGVTAPKLMPDWSECSTLLTKLRARTTA